MHPIDLGQPRLNFDVLRLVCNCLTDVSDVLSFALTCSTLRPGALQRCLGMSPVVLRYGELVNKFHDFVFADTAARAPYIYGLKLHLLGDDPLGVEAPVTTQGLLVAIFQAATRLEYLSLALIVGDSVVVAAGKMTTLRELSIFASFYHQRLHDFLTTLRSPLRYLHIEGYDGDEFSASSIHDELAHFAPTLEVLKLDEFLLDIEPSSVTTQFTSLRSLEVERIPDFGPLSVLLQLFPNLNGTLILGALSQCPEYLHQRLREQNKTAQKTRCWPRLDRVVCNIDLAFVMALECPIRRMEIEASWYRLHYLAEVLHHNCPRQLYFPLAIFQGLDTLDGVFPPSAADRLTHLVMFVDIEIKRLPGDLHRPVNVGWDQFIEMLVRSMRHLRLKHLRLVFHYTVFQSMSKRTEPNAVFDEHFVSTARESDLHPAAIRFLDTIPTLEHIFLTTGGHVPMGHVWGPRNKWLSSKAWRVVVGVGEEPSQPADAALGSRSLVELSPEDAAVVIGREELELSETEQVKLQYCSER